MKNKRLIAIMLVWAFSYGSSAFAQDVIMATSEDLKEFDQLIAKSKTTPKKNTQQNTKNANTGDDKVDPSGTAGSHNDNSGNKENLVLPPAQSQSGLGPGAGSGQGPGQGAGPVPSHDGPPRH